MEEQKKPRGRPKAQTSLANQEYDRLEKQFEDYKKKVDDLTLDRMNAAPKEDVEQQTKISQKDIAKKPDHYLKPIRSIGSKEKFDEQWRDQYNYAKEYVQFIAENAEIIGESIELWTKKFPGVAAEFWRVPVNTPVWGPRYLAEQIKGCSYHRLMTDQSQTTSSDDKGVYYGQMVVDKTINRLNAYPVAKSRTYNMSMF